MEGIPTANRYLVRAAISQNRGQPRGTRRLRELCAGGESIAEEDLMDNLDCEMKIE